MSNIGSGGRLIGMERRQGRRPAGSYWGRQPICNDYERYIAWDEYRNLTSSLRCCGREKVT